MMKSETKMKKIIIDGHNLIPKVPGINLSDIDDENKLTALVGEYCRLARVRAELFFDGSPPGTIQRSRHGLVNVHYVKQGTTADEAILRHLRKEGNNARNLLVVTSDHKVQSEARSLHAAVMPSDQFSIQMQNVLSGPAAAREMKEKIPSAEEVEEMLKLMTAKRDENPKNT